MLNYAALFTDFEKRLEQNPRVNFLWRDFRPDADKLEPRSLARFEDFLINKYGAPFPLPEEDRQLVGFPYTMDIAWHATSEANLPPGIGTLSGGINLANVSASLSMLEFRRHLDYPPVLMEEAPAMQHATMFDCGSAAQVTLYHAHLCYDREKKEFLGLGLEYGLSFLPLPLSIGEYVRAALTWHGGWGWQFLYLSLDDFRQLDGSTLLTLYDLYEGLPALFPDADWSIIETKAKYFALARPHAENYRRNRA